MKTAENVNAPSLGGWMIAAAMGLIAAAVAFVVGDFRPIVAIFIGGIIFLLAGLILGMPWGGTKPLGAEGPAGTGADAAPSVAPETVATAPIAVSSSTADVAPTPAMAETAPTHAPAEAAETVAVDKADGPLRLTAPRNGKADDLKEIEGIGPALEKLCNELGFYHFDQISNWSDADVAWVDQNMKTFKGRIARDKWVAQSRLIVAEGLDAFRIRAKTNDY